jgi:periplasmic protein TonB
MNEWREEREKYSMLLFSIVLHILFLVAFLFFTMQHTNLIDQLPFMQEEQDDQQQQIPLPQINQAKLTPGGTNFGAPLVFQEEPEFEPTEVNPMANDVVTQEESDDQIEEDSVPKESEEQFEESLTDKKTENSKKAADEPVPVAESNQTITEPSKPEAQEQLEVKKEIPPRLTSPAMRRIQQRVREQQMQRQSMDQPGDGQKAAAPVKPRVTLADLAKGFIESINKGGRDAIERNGDPNIRPDFKDLKYLSYIQKAIWYMQNEWKLAQGKLQLRTMQELILSIIITIAKDGTVNGIRIVNPSGSNELDSFLVKGIEKASPLPPVPNHFNTENFEMPLSIIHHQEGGSPWRMRLPTRHRPL